MRFQNIAAQKSTTLFYQVTKRKGTAFLLFPELFVRVTGIT
jgi:hypothetical protein